MIKMVNSELCIFYHNKKGKKIFWQKNSRKFQKSKTWICHALETIYVTFTLY